MTMTDSPDSHLFEFVDITANADGGSIPTLVSASRPNILG